MPHRTRASRVVEDSNAAAFAVPQLDRVIMPVRADLIPFRCFGKPEEAADVVVVVVVARNGYYRASMVRGSTGRFFSAESWPAKYIRRDIRLSRPFVSAGRFSCKDCMNSPIMPMKPPIEAHMS